MGEHRRTPGNARACAYVGIVLALLIAARPAAAQGSPVKMAIGGAGSHAENGALRCVIGEEAQFSLTATDSAGQTVIFEQWLPEVSSSDERVLKAELAEYSPYIVNTVCKADGEAWILAQSGDAKLEFPVLVGRARSRKTPRSRATEPATTPATPATTTTPTTPAVAQGQSINGDRGRPDIAPRDSAGAPVATVKTATPDAPAVAATGLKLYAGYNNVQLTWRAAPGAAGYRVARKDVAANNLVTLTGDQVARDGTGLVRDTTFFDGSATADRQYVYYLATYFQRPNGDYYYPAPEAEARGVATPRSTAGKPWLPADRKDRPKLKSAVLVAGPALNVSWHIKDRAAGYIFFTYVGTRKEPGTSCYGYGHTIVALSSPLAGHQQVTRDSSLVKSVPGMTTPDPEEQATHGMANVPVTMYCLRIHAVYPEEVDGSGTPVLVGYNETAGSSGWGPNADDGIASKPLWVAVRRTCESSSDESRCTPWQVVPTDDLPGNAPCRRIHTRGDARCASAA